MTSQTRTPGSVECLTVTVSPTPGVASPVSLTTQPVAISLDHGATWIKASWLDSPGTTRRARTDTPVTFTARTKPLDVLVRVTDSPEAPIIPAGTISVSQ